MKLAGVLLASLLATITGAASLGCSSPARDDEVEGSADAVTAVDRQAIMDALRAKVKPELKSQDIQFDVSKGTFKATSSFVFLSGKIVLRSSGGPIDYRGTEYQAAIDEGVFDDHIDALLEKRGTRWQVVVRAMGSTDVAWTNWAREHGAPPEIFPGGSATPSATAKAAADRKAVMDALRAKAKPLLKNQDIVFDVSKGRYRAEGDWSFLLGKIKLRSSDFDVDYKGTVYQADIDEGLFDDHVSALFHREGGSWIVKDFEIGATDAAFTTWPSKYGAPAFIIR